MQRNFSLHDKVNLINKKNFYWTLKTAIPSQLAQRWIHATYQSKEQITKKILLGWGYRNKEFFFFDNTSFISQKIFWDKEIFPYSHFFPGLFLTFLPTFSWTFFLTIFLTFFLNFDFEGESLQPNMKIAFN